MISPPISTRAELQNQPAGEAVFLDPTSSFSDLLLCHPFRRTLQSRKEHEAGNFGILAAV